MGLKIIKPGIFTTLQSVGLPGHRAIGIGPGGAMDPVAVRLVNALIGNADTAVALEMHYPAPELRFDYDTVFALGGADLNAELNGNPVGNWRRYKAAAGSTLVFRERTKGQKTYLAVPDGFRRDSRPGEPAERITEAARLEIAGSVRPGPSSRSRISRSLVPVYSRFPTVRVLEGPEFGRLTQESKSELFSGQFSVSNESDRMGYRLSGARLEVTDATEMLSTAVCFGTIQLLPDGDLIALMADHQTTGGYPRIAQVVSVDLPLLGQLGPQNKVAFHPIGLGEAEALAIRFERDLAVLRAAVRLHG